MSIQDASIEIECVSCQKNCFQCNDLKTINDKNLKDPAKGIKQPDNIQIDNGVKFYLKDKIKSTKDGEKDYPNNYVKCLSCATSSYLNVFQNTCIECGNFCKDCEYVPESNTSKCNKCELEHKLTTNTRKCIDPTIEIVGSSFIRILLSLLFTSAFIAICCPKIFSNLSKRMKKNSIESLPIYK